MSIDDLIYDIRSALDENELVDLDQRLARAPNLEKRFSALLLSCWRCNGGAVLAARVHDAMNDGITQRPKQGDKNYG